jgi:AraC family transcriptional regulator, alkane utilization regulator
MIGPLDHLIDALKTIGEECMAQDVDPLVDLIDCVRIASAIFLRGEFNAPWAFASCSADELAQLLGTGRKHPILFHIIQEGTCGIELPSGEAAIAGAGDAFVLPYGDVHRLGWPSDVEPVPVLSLLPSATGPGLPTIRHGGNGPPSKILCGYLNCDDFLFDPLLKALPRLLHIKSKPGATGDLIRAGISFFVESRNNASAGSSVGTRLPELLFVECLRQFAEEMPAAETGWLAASKDPILRRALGLMHGQPDKAWNVEDLASEIGTSRAVLAERFERYLQESPIRYLTKWRLQLAAKLLSSTDLSIGEIAGRVGYSSEEAFSRAFKRILGTAPSSWRAAVAAAQ